MARLEDLKPDVQVKGILPEETVAVIDVKWNGTTAVELTYKTPSGAVANELLYRHDEARLEVVERGRTWIFNANGDLFRLAAEAYRIHLEHLFSYPCAVKGEPENVFETLAHPELFPQAMAALEAGETVDNSVELPTVPPTPTMRCPLIQQKEVGLVVE